jgi:hypothetical protein
VGTSIAADALPAESGVTATTTKASPTMKRATLILASTLLLIAATARADVRGGWTATRHKGDAGRLQLQLQHDDSNHGQSIDLAALSGLTAAQIAATAPTPVTFALRREAGTITFDGTFRNGSGGGEFAFAANPAYLATLRDLDVPVGGGKHHGGSADERLLSLALLDVSTAFIRSMQALGYRESLDDYLAMRIFNVTPELVGEFRDLGMSLTADQLVAGRIHGVSPAYVREMRELGRREAKFDDLIASRIHGATPEFIGEMKERGYGDLDLDDYIAFRIHGVTPGFVEELAGLGYRDLAADDLVAFRIHGVTPAFVEELAGLGYRDLAADDLVAFRIHGVTAKMIRELQDEGYRDVSPDDLVAMRIHGRRPR